MKIISTINEFNFWRKEVLGLIGFVPTMGALHKGHLSLVKESIKLCDITIVSIFLNPKQFSAAEDLDIYPQNIDKDINILSDYSIDCIFIPSKSEMYSKKFYTQINLPDLSKVLEGKSRPYFFQGVVSIVAKLFNIIQPSYAFFGEKDAQQLRIIQQMVTDLNFPIRIISCPIIRENNGLAMSSRNSYLKEYELNSASIIYKSLIKAKNLIDIGYLSANFIKKNIIEEISKEKSIYIDYASIANSYTLEEIVEDIKVDILISIAAYIRNVRLIDNISIDYKKTNS